MTATLGFIGCGNMGRALLEGWLQSGVIDAGTVLVAAKNSAATTARECGVRVATAAQVVSECEVVVLAIKPQQAAAVLRPLRFRAEQLVISVIAGIPTTKIGAGPARIVRTMPNVGSRVARSATVAFAPLGVTPEDQDCVERLFNAVGCLEWLTDEDQFHAGTALVGSGPAYVFLALEAMVEGAVAAGLPESSAHRLAAATIEGAATLARQTGDAPSVLRARVSSPGGTTVAALARLEHHGFTNALVDAIDAAAKRSRELASGEI